MDINAEKFFKPERGKKPRVGPIVVGVDIQTPENMGLILRVSSNFGCKEVLFAYSGATQPSKKSRKIKVTARNAFNLLSWDFCRVSDLDKSLPKNHFKIGLETCESAQNIFEVKSLPKNCIIFLGSESHGLPKEVIQNLDHIYYIPMNGPTISMNVSHALTSLLTLWAAN